ncbi:hypothetical protein ACHQM5_021872 [Ranunculus cassubicifolius]
MAGGGGTQRSLEETPTWAVAVVCFVLVLISIIIETLIHLLGKWLHKKRKRALYEALEKVKAELMLMGFISLLLTVGQGPISKICVPESVGNSWHPCDRKQEDKKYGTTGGSESEESNANRRRLLFSSGASLRRLLAGGGGEDKCAKEGKVSLVSKDGIHQLHIFIFVLAIAHILYCIVTMGLGRLKMRRWKQWERETRTVEYEFQHDPERFRFARDTSFGRRHLHFWSRTPVLIWIVCFFRQFFRSVPKVDYLTLRHGFIMAHLAPNSASRFDFQKYINRSLEEDFKVVVGISPALWFFSVVFLLFNTHGWYSYYWMPFIPLIVILAVGTKLQVIITRMGLRIQERGDVIKGIPTVQPADDLFWFNSPGLILFLIHFVLFQNAFQLAFFAWSWYEFGLRSCYHEKLEDVIIRITMGILIQFLCSYVTLPLYALVTQMGSTMKPTIFNDRVASALKSWHHTAKKQIKQNKASGSVTPLSSRPGTPSRPTTPSYGTSPIHLLRNNVYRSDQFDSLQTSPRRLNIDYESYDSEGSPSPMHRNEDSSSHNQNRGDIEEEEKQPIEMTMTDLSQFQHEINIPDHKDHNTIKDFSFDKRGPR